MGKWGQFHLGVVVGAFKVTETEKKSHSGRWSRSFRDEADRPQPRLPLGEIPPNPLCFHSRVSCCPILILICLCGMIVGVHDACVVAMNADFKHWNIYVALLVLFIWSMRNMSMHWRHFSLCSRAIFCCWMLTHACWGQPGCLHLSYICQCSLLCRWIPMNIVIWWRDKLQPWL